MTMPRIRLDTVIDMLENALAEARDLDGTVLTEDGKNNPANRAINQRLLALSDGVQLAGCLTRSEYWGARGREL